MRLTFPKSVEHSYGLSLEGRKCHCGHAFIEGELVYQISGSSYPSNWHANIVYFCARCLKREGLVW